MAKTPALWQRHELSGAHHRLIWFLVDIGAPGNVLKHSWQGEAARQLGIHRVSLRWQVKQLVAQGILVETDAKGEVAFNMAVFEPMADGGKIRKSA